MYLLIFLLCVPVFLVYIFSNKICKKRAKETEGDFAKRVKKFKKTMFFLFLFSFVLCFLEILSLQHQQEKLERQELMQSQDANKDIKLDF